MTNVRPTDRPTDDQRWEPPRGIWYETGKRAAAPFLLRWREKNKRRSQSFSSEAEREKAARKLADRRDTHGREILTFDPKEWRRWLEFKAEAGGIDPLTVLREWKANAARTGFASLALSVPQAVAEYATFRQATKVSRDTERHIQKHVVERFGGYFAATRLAEINEESISRWLASLRNTRRPNIGAPMDPLTLGHHRKDVNTFFDFCITKGWLTRNPCRLVPVPEVEEEDVTLLTVEEGQALFAANSGYRIAGRLALEAFGFLRASSAGRLERAHVNFAERGIRMPGMEHKSRKAKFRQGHPDALWAWLNRAPDETWEMSWWEYRNEKRDAFVRAGIKGGSENRLRKTCLSAHLAWLKNQPLTSYLAQHRHTSTTDIYLGVMTEAQGRAWFQIGPQFTC